MTNEIEHVSAKDEFMSEMEKLRPDLMYPESWDETRVDLANKVVASNGAIKQMFASIPMVCKGSACPMKSSCELYEKNLHPLGKKCHPAGTKIETVSHGLVNIEDLDENIHTLISIDLNDKNIIKNNRKKGFKFKLSTKSYCGQMITLKTANHSHKVTADHITIARFNEKAIGKFCVYLMQKGDFWRIGKSKIASKSKTSKHGHKTHLGFPIRGNQEEAEAMWILGVYDTNTDALLAEEYLSLKFQVSKVSFSDSLKKYNSKYDGIYKWATKEQIDEHHKRLFKPKSFYAAMLGELGLDINYPIWENIKYAKRDSMSSLTVRWTMSIRACNLIPEIMDIPILSNPSDMHLSGSKRRWQPDWEELSIDRENYCGDVYALDVEKHHTYFANKIATHNCPIEMRIIRDLSSSLGKSLNIDYEDFTEVSQLRVMVDQEIQMIRKSHFLAEEGFIMENVIGVSDDGEAITKKELSLGVELEDRIHKRLKDYGERLIATRAARAKLNGGETDSAKVAAKIMREIATIDRERERLVQIELGDVLDAEVIED
jgi:uncharacterized protein (DUF2249 family)